MSKGSISISRTGNKIEISLQDDASRIVDLVELNALLEQARPSMDIMEFPSEDEWLKTSAARRKLLNLMPGLLRVCDAYLAELSEDDMRRDCKCSVCEEIRKEAREKLQAILTGEAP